MSTNIDDLPGPHPEEDDIEEESLNSIMSNNDNERPLRGEQYYEQPTLIKMDIKKIKKEDGILDIIKKEINEENVVLLVLFYIASTTLINDYAKKLLNTISLSISDFAVNVVKGVTLLLIFIAFKYVILPYIKL